LIGYVVFEIRAISGNSIFGCMTMDHANFGVVHARYHVIRMSGVKSNLIFGFRVPIFPIHSVTFMELSLKISDVTY